MQKSRFGDRLKQFRLGMRNDGADRNGGEKRKWMDGRRKERKEEAKK